MTAKKEGSFLPLLVLTSLLLSCGSNAGEQYHDDKKIYGDPAVYDVLQKGDIPIGMWVTPTSKYRNEEAYKKIADCGITTVNGFYYSDGTETEIKEVLGYCEKYKLNYLLNSKSIESEVMAYADDPVQTHIDNAMNEIRLYASSPALSGVLFLDEPNAKYFDAIGAFYQRFNELYPGKLAYVNNLPYEAVAGSGYSRYEDYLNAFLDKTGSRFWSYDNYPLLNYDPSQPDYKCEAIDFYYNLDLVRSATLQRRIPFWCFAQALSYDNHRSPSREDLRWDVFSNLAFGAKGIQYFCYFTPGQDSYGEGLVSRSGVETARYAYAQELNREIKTYTPYLLNADAIGVMMNDYRRNGYRLYETPLTKFGPIKSVEGNRYLIGCFSDQTTGDKSILITPTTPRDDIEITLNLYSSVHEVEAMEDGKFTALSVKNGKLALRLQKGNALYIRFKN